MTRFGIAKVTLGVWLVLSLRNSPTPSADRNDEIDDFITSEMQREHVPGAWVMIRHNGHVVKLKGYGIANLEDGSPVTANTLMQTGSIGKMFTAAGVLLLAQDGTLKLSDSIASYFPGSPRWWDHITIEDLLTHTGGMPEYEGNTYCLDLKHDYTEDQLIRFAQSMKPAFPPGTHWAYSNTDYMILGVLIHRVTGEFYGDFLRDRIWRPAGMPTMRVISNLEVIPRRACGYDWADGQWLNQDWVSGSLNSTADGTCYATPADFVAWDAALDNESVLPRGLEALMWRPMSLSDGSSTGYGLGWCSGELLGHRYVGHSGAWQGFQSAYYRFNDDHYSVCIFENSSSGDPAETAFEIAKRFGPLTDQRASR